MMGLPPTIPPSPSLHGPKWSAMPMQKISIVNPTTISTKTPQFQTDKYRLSVSGYEGNLSGHNGWGGDALGYHNGMQFTTMDQDNDLYGAWNCAQHYRGAWWHNGCFHLSLNGINRNNRVWDPVGIVHFRWRGHADSMKAAQMAIKLA